MKYAILNKNYENFNHPKTQLPIRLYRIIAMKDFQIGDENEEITIREGTVGGLVQAKTLNGELVCNLPQDDGSWIFNTAKLFDNAELKNSILKDNAMVFGNAKLSNSIATGRSRCFDNCIIEGSFLTDNVDICDNAIVKNSQAFHASKICGNSEVINTELNGTNRIYSSFVRDSKMFDIAEVTRNSKVIGCHLSKRAVISNREITNETISEDIELNEIIME